MRRPQLPIASEAILHQQVIQWLRVQHPKVIFRTDFSSGVKMTIGQAALHKRLQWSRAWPDIQLLEPRGQYRGAFFELKREDVVIYNKRHGGMRRDPHLLEQAAMLDSLRERGYYAEFAVGFSAFQTLVNNYLKS